jgi:hypothetical protein
MSVAPQSTTKNLSAKERLEHAQRELAQVRARINRSSILTAIVGAVALALLAGYFYYGSLLWAEVSNPDKLVNLAQTMFDDSIPDASKILEKEVVKSSPKWAEGLSKQLLASVPDGRKQLEKLVIDQLDQSIQEADLVTEKEFTSFLRKNRTVMDERFKELGKNPKLAEQSVAELVSLLEEDAQLDLKTDATHLLKTLKFLVKNGREISTGRDLDEGQRLERRAWMLGRALFLEETDKPLLQKFRASMKPEPPVRAQKRKPPIPKKPNNDAKPAKVGANVLGFPAQALLFKGCDPFFRQRFLPAIAGPLTRG